MTNEEFIAVAKAKVFENYRDRIINNFAAFPELTKSFCRLVYENITKSQSIIRCF